MIWSRLASSADGLAVGKDVQRAVRQLAGEIPAGGAGIEGDHHPFVNPGQRFAGDVGFMRVMAFQAHVERIAAVWLRWWITLARPWLRSTLPCACSSLRSRRIVSPADVELF